MTADIAPIIPGGRYACKWTKEAVIRAIQAWAEEHGSPPAVRDWRHAGPSWPNTATVRQMFGFWHAALEAAGFETKAYPPAARRYSNEQILAAIRQAFAEGDRFSSAFRPLGRRRPSMAVIRTRFGTWNNAVTAAGLLGQQEQYHLPLYDPEWLRREYVERGRGTPSIAVELGSSNSTVFRALQRFGIPTHPRGYRGSRETA